MKKLIEEYDLMLAGTQYLDKDLNSKYYNAEGSRAGTVFELYHETDNLYDPLAIMVLYKGKEIGYIPKDENLEIAYYLYHPEQFVVECRQKKKQIRGDFEMIVVIIKVFAITENYRKFSFEVFDEVFADYDECVEKLAQKRNDIKEEEEQQMKEIEQERERKRIERRQKKAEKKKEEEKKAFQGCLIFIFIITLISGVYYIIKNNPFSSVEKYYIIIERKDYTFSEYGSYEEKIDSIETDNLLEAYKGAFTKYRIDAELSEGLRSDILNAETVGFRLIKSKDEQDVTDLLPKEKRDSIEAVVLKITDGISEKYKLQRKKINSQK